MYDLAIINGEIYLEDGFNKKNIYINGESIVKISENFLKANEVYDAKNKLVIPGIIDPHVHFELDLGKIKSLDDFLSGSVSAAYGGITTIIDFLDPINKADDLEKELIKRKKLAEKSIIDYKFHAAIKNPVNEVSKIVAEMNRLKLKSVKLFTTYSDSNRRTYDKEIFEILNLSKENDFIVLAHIENDDLIQIKDNYKIKDLSKSRPTLAETKEVLKLAEMVKCSDGKLYMVHLSSGDTLEALLNSYKDILNKNMYIESCPHYFVLNNENFLNDNGFLYAVAPPLRNKNELEKLNKYYMNINTIATDHCSFLQKDKNKENLKDIAMGIGSIEHSFNIMYTLFGESIINKMTSNTAKIFSLYPNKGSLLENTDADLFIYNPNRKHKINSDHSLSDYSVYNGFEVNGEVESTMLRGKFIIKNKKLITKEKGKYIEI